MRNLLDERLQQVILPQKYLEELKNAPDDRLSFQRSFENVCTTKRSFCPSSLKSSHVSNMCQAISYPHSGGPTITDVTIPVIKKDLTRSIGLY